MVDWIRFHSHSIATQYLVIYHTEGRPPDFETVRTFHIIHIIPNNL